MEKIEKKLPVWLLPLLLIALAFGLRVYQIDQIPPGLWYDEAIHGLDTLQIYEGHQFPIFFNTDNHPQEPMFSYLIALFYGLFGVSAMTLRLTSALLGTLTVALFYPIANRWFGRRVALYGMFFLAISKWHLMFSRLCFRTILTPLFALGVLYFLYNGLKQEKETFQWQPFLWSGVLLGLGQYTYISFRIVPILVILLVLHETWYQRDQGKEYISRLIKGGGLALVSGFIVFLPLLMDYIQNPYHFFGRTDEISIFQKGILPGLQFIGANTLKTLGMFSILGDPEIKHNYPGEPMLPLILSLFLLWGIITAFRQIKDYRMAMLLAWLGIFLAPGILSQGAPNTLRTLGGVPALCLLLAVGTEDVLTNVKNRWGHRGLPWIRGIMAAILLYSLLLVGYQYFYKWGRDPRTAQHFNINEYRLAETVREQAETADFYLPDVLAEQRVVQFVTRPVVYREYKTLDDLPQPGTLKKDMVIVSLNPNRYGNINTEMLNEIMKRYPGAWLDMDILGVRENPWIIALHIPGNGPSH